MEFYVFVLLYVISTLVAMFLAVKWAAYLVNPQGPAYKEWQVYVIALMFGALGALCVYAIAPSIRTFDRTHRFRYLLIDIGLLAIQIAAVVLLVVNGYIVFAAA